MSRSRDDNAQDGASFDALTGVTARISLTAVTVTDRHGIVSEGFGDLIVRAGDGRAVTLEIVEDLSGLKVAGELDWGRPRRARSHLQADTLRDAIDKAARRDGMSSPFPELKGSEDDGGQP